MGETMGISWQQLDKIKKILYGEQVGIIYPTEEDIIEAEERLNKCKEIYFWYDYEWGMTLCHALYKSPSGSKRALVGVSKKEHIIHLAFYICNTERFEKYFGTCPPWRMRGNVWPVKEGGDHEN